MFINRNSNIMKLISALILCTVFLSLYNCKTPKESTLQFQSTAPLEILGPYYSAWIAGVEGGGSGINVFLPLKENGKTVIDSLHYRGQKTAVETRDNLIVGRFSNSINQKKDLIMSSSPEDEYNNKAEFITDRSPFKLPQNACVISYKMNGKRLYYKISNLKRKETIAYPSAPPQNH